MRIVNEGIVYENLIIICYRRLMTLILIIFCGLRLIGYTRSLCNDLSILEMRFLILNGDIIYNLRRIVSLLALSIFYLCLLRAACFRFIRNFVLNCLLIYIIYLHSMYDVKYINRMEILTVFKSQFRILIGLNTFILFAASLKIILKNIILITD